MRDYLYRSVRIVKHEYGPFCVHGRAPAFGDYQFNTLGKAKDFIDRMAGEWGLAE